jgi:hypothetical protein
MKMPAAGGGGLRQSLYDDDVLTDGLAEARAWMCGGGSGLR